MTANQNFLNLFIYSKNTILIEIYYTSKSACNAGNPSSISGSGRSPGEGKGNPLQSSYLENPIDRGAWRATVHGVAKNWTRLSY